MLRIMMQEAQDSHHVLSLLTSICMHIGRDRVPISESFSLYWDRDSHLAVQPYSRRV